MFSRCSAESRRATVDVFLKAAGYLDCAIRQVLPQIPLELRYCIVKELIGSIGFQSLKHLLQCFLSNVDPRRQLPVDLAEGNLKALSLQALGQVQSSRFYYLFFITAPQIVP
jgi:hypothetical protein